MLRYFIVAMLFCGTGMARAEGGTCPSGMYPIGGPGQGCAPIPGYYDNDNGAVEPAESIPMVWEERWGAVVSEADGSGFGAIAGARSKDDAENEALQRCRSTVTSNQDKCRVRMSYRNQCVAYAWGGGYSGVARAIDKSTADSLALLTCAEGTKAECKVYYSDCSYAEAVRP